VYAQRLSLIVVPRIEINSPVEFVDQSIGAISMFIEHTRITGRAKVIFEHRVIKNSLDRRTLKETARIAGGDSSTIKREETELLKRLKQAIYEHDYTGCGVRFSAGFISFWREAKGIYLQGNDINAFSQRLAIGWSVPHHRLKGVIPLLIAVISGRPEGCPRKDTLRDDMGDHPTGDEIGLAPVMVASAPTIIRLRGFRSVY